MANARTTRDQETRDQNPSRYVYTPTSALPDPTPEPGFRFRWIASAILGQTNQTNLSKRFREGWVPVKAEDHPELQIMGDKNGNVEIGGLLLCKAPEEMVMGRQTYYNNSAKEQMESVDNNFMRNNDSRMPLFNERKSSVTKGPGFGNGSK
jgi:hypothetical protein